MVVADFRRSTALFAEKHRLRRGFLAGRIHPRGRLRRRNNPVEVRRGKTYHPAGAYEGGRLHRLFSGRVAPGQRILGRDRSLLAGFRRRAASHPGKCNRLGDGPFLRVRWSSACLGIGGRDYLPLGNSSIKMVSGFTPVNPRPTPSVLPTRSPPGAHPLRECRRGDYKLRQSHNHDPNTGRPSHGPLRLASAAAIHPSPSICTLPTPRFTLNQPACRPTASA
jgi:hypothetical protein